MMTQTRPIAIIGFTAIHNRLSAKNYAFGQAL
jgi:hypothetical protein